MSSEKPQENQARIPPDQVSLSSKKKRRKIWPILDVFTCISLLAGSVAFFAIQYHNVTSQINNERETYISEVTGKIANNIDSRLVGLKSESTIYKSAFTQSNVASFADCKNFSPMRPTTSSSSSWTTKAGSIRPPAMPFRSRTATY
jgi:hypothetical protein